MRIRAWVIAAVAVAAALLAAPAASAQRSSVVVDGSVRFEAITPTLIRLEHSPRGRFEERPTQTTVGGLRGGARLETTVRGGVRVIRTSRLTLRWKRGSGPLDRGDLRVRLGKRGFSPALGPDPRQLGGWRRSLDLVDGPVPLHEGMLSRRGWYLLDDSATALIDRGWFSPRPGEAGYQDLYLFAYGRDYARGLRDLRRLTGPAPLPPRKAFGVWFSRWWPYGAADWRALVERFRRERVPLDTISIDTDFKRVHDPVGARVAANAVGSPGDDYSWNGWDWNRDLYPDPRRFLDWAATDAGVEVGLNLHPSISSTDPRFPQTQAAAGGALRADGGCRVPQADPTGDCMVFDWTDRAQVRAYFDLHEPFERQGPLFWWLDWCCDGSSADAPGLTPDTWVNRLYAQRQRERGSRWPAFQRIGGSLQAGFGGRVGNGAFAEHTTTIQFTGDTCGSWPLIGFASEFTAAAASIGQPYVSHDIGSFHSVSPTGTCDKDASPILTPRFNSLPDDMYVRWIQLGTAQPFDRLHSHHGKRLPWEYPPPIERIASEFLRLRGALVPFLYTLAAEARRTGLPIARASYLTWPRRPAAYRHPSQYTLGRDVLVAPVSEPGDPAEVEVWFPPGRWVDWFTGRRFRGPGLRTLQVPLERMPLFRRAGSLLPTQPPLPNTAPGPPPKVVLIADAGNGSGYLYDDSGRGFAHERGASATTRFRQVRRGGTSRITIEAARGGFGGMPARRSWELRLSGVDRPREVRVGGRTTRRWSYSAAAREVSVRVGERPTSRSTRVLIR